MSGARPPSIQVSDARPLVAGEVKIPEIDRGLRIREGLKDLAPTLCLVGTLAAAGIVYFASGDPAAHYVGFAQTTTQTVAPLETARVSKILVAVGQRVAAGQIVATLDTATIDAEIAVAEAKRAQLDADMRVEKAIVEQDLDEHVEGLERERAKQREEQARATAEAKAIDGEVTRVKQLVEQRQAVTDDLAQLGLKQAAANAVTSAKPQTLRVLSKQLQAAEERRLKAKDQSSDLSLPFLYLEPHDFCYDTTRPMPVTLSAVNRSKKPLTLDWQAFVASLLLEPVGPGHVTPVLNRAAPESVLLASMELAQFTIDLEDCFEIEGAGVYRLSYVRPMEDGRIHLAVSAQFVIEDDAAVDEFAAILDAGPARDTFSALLKDNPIFAVGGGAKTYGWDDQRWRARPQMLRSQWDETRAVAQQPWRAEIDLLTKRDSPAAHGRATVALTARPLLRTHLSPRDPRTLS